MCHACLGGLCWTQMGSDSSLLFSSQVDSAAETNLYHLEPSGTFWNPLPFGARSISPTTFYSSVQPCAIPYQAPTQPSTHLHSVLQSSTNLYNC